MSAMKWFIAIIILQLFYGAGITMLSYAMPADTLQYTTAFSDTAGAANIQDMSNQMQDSLNKQSSLPLIDLGALVFYSGNILIDMLLNTVTALPQMVNLLVIGLMELIGLQAVFTETMQLLVMIGLTIMYIISIIQMLMNIRTRGAIQA